MKIYLLINLILVFILVNSYKCINFCCCIYSKDPFRGFQHTNIKMINFDPSGMEKAEIGNKLMKVCYETHGGFPSIDNIDKLKKLKLVCEEDPEILASRREEKECENECNYLMRELNEKFNVNQEENRHGEAKTLRDKRRKLNKLMDKKIMENVGNFYKGKKCEISIKTKYKEIRPVFNKKIDKDKFEVNTIHTDDISFDSITDIGQLQINSNDAQMNYMLSSHSRNQESQASLAPTLTSTQLENSDIDLEKEIEKLDNEIMCLERKNRRSIDYILDRFSIPDDILVRIIRIFERSLDDVIKKMRHYFEDTVYFQFRIADKLNKIQVKKAELKKI
jgi:hypothetical protein